MLLLEGKNISIARETRDELYSHTIDNRGARVKAMAICTRHQYLHIYKVRNSNESNFFFQPHLLNTPLLFQIILASTFTRHGKIF